MKTNETANPLMSLVLGIVLVLAGFFFVRLGADKIVDWPAALAAGLLLSGGFSIAGAVKTIRASGLGWGRALPGRTVSKRYKVIDWEYMFVAAFGAFCAIVFIVAVPLIIITGNVPKKNEVLPVIGFMLFLGLFGVLGPLLFKKAVGISFVCTYCSQPLEKPLPACPKCSTAISARDLEAMKKSMMG